MIRFKSRGNEIWCLTLLLDFRRVEIQLRSVMNWLCICITLSHTFSHIFMFLKKRSLSPGSDHRHTRSPSCDVSPLDSMWTQHHWKQMLSWQRSCGVWGTRAPPSSRSSAKSLYTPRRCERRYTTERAEDTNAALNTSSSSSGLWIWPHHQSRTGWERFYRYFTLLTHLKSCENTERQVKWHNVTWRHVACADVMEISQMIWSFRTFISYQDSQF